jgi:hypothetical protein
MLERVRRAWRWWPVQWLLLLALVVAVVGWAYGLRPLATQWGTVGGLGSAIGTTVLAAFAFASAFEDRHRRREQEKEAKRSQARKIHGWWQEDEAEPDTYKLVVANDSDAEVRQVSATIDGDTIAPGRHWPEASFMIPTLPRGAERIHRLPRRPMGGTAEPWIVLDFFDRDDRLWKKTRARLEHRTHPDGLREGEEDLSDPPLRAASHHDARRGRGAASVWRRQPRRGAPR